jgi:hypothetical protein
MKLVTFERDGVSEPGVLLDNKVIGLKSAGFPTLLHLIEGGTGALQRAKDWLEKAPAEAAVPLAKARLLGSFAASPENYLRGSELS